MNILYIAYSCSPFHGSEDKIGWNIPVESAKSNKVVVITKEEQRESIEKYLCSNTLENIRFYYVDIPNVYKKIFSGAIYSGRLNVWNKRALKKAKEICAQERIDIIHQITPVEFRSIGDYGRIPNVKFVCGPIAGGQTIPKELKKYTQGRKIVELVRSSINLLYRFGFMVTGKLHKCDYLLYANHETKGFLSKVAPRQDGCDLLTDVAVDLNDLREFGEMSYRNEDCCRFLVVGRLVYLKGHEFLLDALMRIPKELDYVCNIVGQGKELENLKKKCTAAGLDHCVHFVGAVPYTQISEVYASSDVLIMPSFREATGSVLMEAMANGLPVITINKFGGAMILDEETGWLYDGQSQEAYVDNLKEKIILCINSREEVVRRGKNARKHAEKYTWKEKMKIFQSIYEMLYE